MTDTHPENRKRYLLIGVSIIGALALIGGATIYLGAFNVAADQPHTALFAWLTQTVRDRSIAVRVSGIDVPHDLAKPNRIKRGAAEYGEMCAMCHLGPGVERSEISQGLYPPAPELARDSDLSVAEDFWVIKHGVKMTAMPAWGVTHDDAILWDIVAFLRKLPRLTPDQYKTLTKDAAAEHEEMRDHGAMPAMKP